MSGGDSTGGSWGPDEDVLDCASIFERCILNSPKEATLAKLSPGDVLSIELVQYENKTSLVAMTTAGEIAGSITSASLSKIKKCMESGTYYKGIVEDIDGGRCTILIRPEATL